jgi:hypothetical protein
MAYSIFSDSSNPHDFKAIVGGAVNASFELASIAPQFGNTHQQRMEEWLGDTIYFQLVGNLASDSVTDDQERLLPLYQKALAWLTLHDYLPFAEAQITEAGVSRVETDSHKTAYKDQVRKIQAQCITNGYEAMERLIIYLDGMRVEFPDWVDAPGFLKYHGVMLNTALAFRSVYDKSVTRQVFEESLFGCVADAEAFSIVKLMGQAQYDALLLARQNNDWTTEAKEKKAILLSQKISAHFSLKEALTRNYVRLEGNRVVQIEYLAEQAVPREGTASALAVGVRSQLHDDRANAYLKSLRDYLDANIEDAAFADYKAYQEELAAAEEAYQEARGTANAEAAVQYGQGCCHDLSERCDGGNAFGFGMGYGTNRKGVGRL